MPIAAALLLGATAGAGAIFCLHWRLKKSLVDGMSVCTPTESPRESAAEGEETPPPAAVPGKAETAAEAVPSAREPEPQRAPEPQADPPSGESRGGQGDGQDKQLLDLLEAEARKATERLARENAELRKRNAELARRNRDLGARLAEAMAALDLDETRRMPAAEAAPGDVDAEGARVLDANAGLGLVVLDRGALHGLRYGTPMSVFRGRKQVARVRVVDVRERIAGAAVVETAADDWPREGDRAAPARAADSEGK